MRGKEGRQRRIERWREVMMKEKDREKNWKERGRSGEKIAIFMKNVRKWI